MSDFIILSVQFCNHGLFLAMDDFEAVQISGVKAEAKRDAEY